MFTRENISSLPVPDAKFQEAKSVYLGQLIVTAEMVAKKINSRTNQYSTCKSVQLIIKRGSSF